MNLEKEFKSFGTKHLGIPSTTIESVINHQVESSMTPYILEERSLNVTQMDVFSRLMKDRLLFLNGVVDDRMSSIVSAQLLFLSSVDTRDISMYIDSPGGSVKSGLTMVDMIQYIPCDVSTVNMGICASMASILLGSGTKGKRSSLRFSRTMLHQSSGGAGGNIQDAEISWKQWNKYNDILFNLLGDFCGKTAEQVKADTSRDFWLDAQESIDYGIIDEIILKK